MTEIIGQPKWSPIRLLEEDEYASGGKDGNMNEQAYSLADRTEYLNQEKANKADIIQGQFSFSTMAAFDAKKATLPLNCTVIIDEVGPNQGTNTWNGVELKKSVYDPFQLVMNEVNANPIYKAKLLSLEDNLNSIIKPGIYQSWGTNDPTLIKNYPLSGSNGYGILHVYHLVTGSTGTVAMQMFYSHSSNGIWYRTTNVQGNAWTAWDQLITKQLLKSTSMLEQLSENADLNNYITRGEYIIDTVIASQNKYLNLPPQMIETYGTASGGVLTVKRSSQSNVVIQYFDGYADYGSYFRSMYSGGSWSPWSKVGNRLQVLTNKNLNNIISTGFYLCNSIDYVADNFPVLDQILLSVMSYGNVYRQIAYRRATNEIYTRSYWGTNLWQPWIKLALQSDIDSLNGRIDTALAGSYYNYNLHTELSNPFKHTRIKLIGDSITWGMGGSAGSPIDPRTGKLTDVRNTLDTSISKTWANLLRSWIAKVYGDGIVTENKPGSGFTISQICTTWSDTYKVIKMTDKNGSVVSDAVKLSYITYLTTHSFHGSYINLIGPNFQSLRPVEMEVSFEGDNISIAYLKHAVGDANDMVEVYLDGNLYGTFSYYDTTTDSNAYYEVNCPDGSHVLRIKNISTSVNSYTSVYGFKFNKKIYLANDGIIGSSTKTWLEWSLLDGSLDGKDDYLIMMLGTNDRGTVGGLDDYKKRLRLCVDKIKTLSPKTKIILASSTFANNEIPTTYRFHMKDVDQVNQKLANELGIPFISHYKYCAQSLLDNQAIWSDGLHLNDNGNRLYFENIVKNLFIK